MCGRFITDPAVIPPDDASNDFSRTLATGQCIKEKEKENKRENIFICSTKALS